MFHVGQEVVCVDASEVERHLRQGQTYTISHTGYMLTGDAGIGVAEAIGRDKPSWFPWRFRPVLRRQTDITIFEEILRNTKVPANV